MTDLYNWSPKPAPMLLTNNSKRDLFYTYCRFSNEQGAFHPIVYLDECQKLFHLK